MKSYEPRRTFPVAGCSTSLSLHDPEGFETWTWHHHLVTVDEARALVEQPYVLVKANRFESPSWLARGGDAFETGWSVYAIALTEDEAEQFAHAAVEELRADIRAGNIKRGRHDGYIPRNPLEPPVEAQLRAYREQVLHELEAMA